jgi:hypothetical protein
MCISVLWINLTSLMHENAYMHKTTHRLFRAGLPDGLEKKGSGHLFQHLHGPGSSRCLNRQTCGSTHLPCIKIHTYIKQHVCWFEQTSRTGWKYRLVAISASTCMHLDPTTRLSHGLQRVDGEDMAWPYWWQASYEIKLWMGIGVMGSPVRSPTQGFGVQRLMQQRCWATLRSPHFREPYPNIGFDAIDVFLVVVFFVGGGGVSSHRVGSSGAVGGSVWRPKGVGVSPGYTLRPFRDIIFYCGAGRHWTTWGHSSRAVRMMLQNGGCVFDKNL